MPKTESERRAIAEAQIMVKAEAARRDINLFVEFCIDDDKTPGIPVKQGWGHREVQGAIPDLGTPGNTLILCHRDFGKCLAEGTRVGMADGRTKAIEDVRVGDTVLSMTEEWRCKRRSVERSFDTGRKECLRVELLSRQEVVCSLDHRFRTLDEWVKASDLAVGDYVAVASHWDSAVEGSGVPEETAALAVPASGQMQWGKITSIEAVGTRKTYDLQVEKDRCYFANGILVHNSVQSIARVLWEIGRNPELRVKVINSSDLNAQKTVNAIRTHVEENWRLHRVFPGLKPKEGGKWSGHALTVDRKSRARDATVEAYGVESAAAGGRSDLLLFDDVVEWRNAIKHPTLREVVKGAYHEVWSPILANDGREIFLGTIYHSDDLCSELLNDKSGVYNKVVIPLLWTEELVRRYGADEDLIGTPTWPEKWSEEAINRALVKCGGRRIFDRQYMLSALPGEDLLFSEEAIRMAKLESYDFSNWDQPGSPVNPDWPRYLGVDLASSLSSRGAFTVLFTCAVDPDTQCRYPINIVRKKMKFPDVVRSIVAQYERFRHTRIVVENNAFQDAVVTQLGEDRKDMPIKGQMTGNNKWDADIGLPGLAAKMENGGWRIPWRGGDAVHRDGLGHNCVICEYVRELTQAPFGATSDILMAMWLCDCAAGTKKTLKAPPTTIYTKSQLKGEEQKKEGTIPVA